MKNLPVNSKENGEQPIDPLKKIEEELLRTATSVKNVNILFLDISSTCTGYSIANVDFENKRANITKAGCLWFGDWDHQEKFLYMFEAMQNYFYVVEAISYSVVEQYSINPKKLNGVSVVSELQGAIKTGLWSNGIKVDSIVPQQWRKILGIKPTTEVVKGKTKRDYKTPTKEKVLTLVKVPETVTSNITNQDRATPSDVYDSIAICWAWLNKIGIKTVTGNNTQFNSHIGLVNE